MKLGIIIETFGFTYRKFNRNAIIPSFILIAAGIALLYFVPGKTSVLIAMPLLGASYGNASFYAYAHGSSIVPKSRIDEAIGIVTAGYGLGMFMATYFTTWLMGVFNTQLFTPVLIGLFCQDTIG